MSRQLTKMSSIIEDISMGPFGSDIKVENFVNDGVPVLNGSNLTDFKLVENEFKYVTPDKAKTFKKAIARRGDIVITHRGTLGQISFIPDNSKYEEYVISQSQFRVTLNRKIADPAYFVYYFHTSEGQQRLLANKCHVGVPALAQATTNFKLIEIPLPDITIQQQIATVLSSLDAKIELNNRINAELEAMAKTLYDYWFVQFEFPSPPVEGCPQDRVGSPPAEGCPKDGVGYKSSGGKMVWNNQLKREIPLGWGSGNLLMLSNLEGGGTPSKTKDQYWKGTIPFYTPTDYTSSVFTTNTQAFISKDGLDNCSSKLFPKGTIFITARGTVGNVIIASTETAMNQSCYAFCPKTDIDYSFLYFSVKSLISILKAKSGGSVFNSIVSNDIKQAKLAIPPTSLVQKYANVCNPIFEKILIKTQENQHLSSLRDWLLPMLMNGQISVIAAEKAIYRVEEELRLAAEPEEIINHTIETR